MDAAAARSSDNDRYPCSPAIPAFRGEVRDLIESTRYEVCELHFRNRAHSHQCGTDRRSHDSRFRYRRVDDPPLAELFQHSRRHFECAAVDPDVFTQDEHTLVLFHLFPDALTNCFNVGSERHQLGFS